MGQVHAYLVKNRVESFLSAANAFINAYSKYGQIDGAFQCFLSVERPDLVTWRSIMCAFSFSIVFQKKVL